MNEARANPQAYDADARRRLRALSLELTGLVVLSCRPGAPQSWLAKR